MLRLNKSCQLVNVKCDVLPRDIFQNTHFEGFKKAPLQLIKTPDDLYHLFDHQDKALLRYVISADASRALHNGCLIVAVVSADSKNEFNHCDLADVVSAGGFISFLKKPIEINGVKKFIRIDDNDGSHAPQHALPRVALCLRALGCDNIIFFENYSKKSDPNYNIHYTQSLDFIFQIPQERAIAYYNLGFSDYMDIILDIEKTLPATASINDAILKATLTLFEKVKTIDAERLKIINHYLGIDTLSTYTGQVMITHEKSKPRVTSSMWEKAATKAKIDERRNKFKPPRSKL